MIIRLKKVSTLTDLGKSRPAWEKGVEATPPHFGPFSLLNILDTIQDGSNRIQGLVHMYCERVGSREEI